MNNGILASLIVVFFAAFFFGIGYFVGYRDAKHVYHHCTHGESSIAGVMKDGKFHITQPPTKTGC
jgi:hypothetical protein